LTKSLIGKGGVSLASFADLTARLNLNIQNFASNLNSAAGMMNQFARTMNGTINSGMADPAKKAYTVFTDVKRIVQGILISQAFYQGMRAIKDATSATWEFASSLEYAQIAYSNLFGNTELATEFINVLKDFAAVTPFGFTEAEKAAKRLLAYGIEYKNVMYVMQGVLSASTMTGSAQTIESVSRALGQINTKGRLYNEEMRQLTEAGIPAYEILQEKLGLTQDQLKNLAKNAVPASVAINALVDGINERFGGVAQASNLTMQGLFANLKDNLLMISSEAIQPLFNRIKALLVPFVEFVTELRMIVDTQGLGGLFERLIPPEMQATIRMFIANLMNLWTVVKINLANAFKVFKIVLEAVIRVFNAFAPVVTAVLDVTARITQAILSNEKAVRFLTMALAACAAMWIIFKIQAVASAVVAGVVNLISKAVLGLYKALTFVVAHPFWALLIGLVGVVVGLSGGFNKLGDAVNGFFKKLTQFNGVDPDKLLLPSQKERAADLDKFNQKLSGTGDAMDSLADKTGKATKAAKGLLSFDEVFKLNQPDEGTDAGATDWGDFELPDFGGMGEALIPEVPSFEGFATDFVDNLLDALGGKEKLLSAGIGALLGAALGGLIGGPLGAKIGAIIGAIAGWFWPEVAKALGLTDVGTVALPIATVLGAAIGWVAGGPLGAVVGAAIGALVGWIIDRIAKGLETGDWTGIGLPIGIGLGAGIGFLIGGPLGALIGGAIGALVGHVVDLFIDGFTNGNWDAGGIAMSLGPLIGAGIGMIVGGPAGAAIGAAIGLLVGWIVDLIVDNWDAIVDWFKGVGKWFGEVFSAIGTFFANVGSAIGKFFGNVGRWLADAWTNLKTWFSNVLTSIGDFFKNIWSNVSGWFSNLFTKIGEFFGGIWDTVSTFFSDLWKGIVEWASDIFAPLIDAFNNLFSFIGQVMSDIWLGITTVWNDIKTAVVTVATQIWETLSEIFSFIKDLVVKIVTDIWTTVSTFFSDLWEKFSTWISDIWTKFTTWLGDIWNKISEWFGQIWEAVSGFFSQIWEAVSGFFSDIWDSFSTWVSDVWTKFTTWLSDIWNKFTEWVGQVIGKVATFFSDIWNKFTEWAGQVIGKVATFFSDIWNKLTTWVGQVIGKVATFFSDIWNKLTTWVGQIVSKIGEFFGNIWNSITSWFSKFFSKVGELFSNIVSSVVNFVANVINKFTNFFSDLWTEVENGVSNIYNTFKNWISDLWNNVFEKFFGWISDGISKLREFFGLESKAKNTDTSYTDSGSTPEAGHATGGIFRREHVARFAEGNKAEAVIPLENASAMQPFVTAISDGIMQGLMPTFAALSANNNRILGGGDSENLRPLYVGTLIADERSLKELQRKMHVIELNESQRRGV